MDSYDSYGNDVYHNEGDKIQLECKRGYVNTVGQNLMVAECKCKTGETCAWTKRKLIWNCVEEEVRIS